MVSQVFPVIMVQLAKRVNKDQKEILELLVSKVTQAALVNLV